MPCGGAGVTVLDVHKRALLTFQEALLFGNDLEKIINNDVKKTFEVIQSGDGTPGYVVEVKIECEVYFGPYNYGIHVAGGGGGFLRRHLDYGLGYWWDEVNEEVGTCCIFEYSEPDQECTNHSFSEN